MIFPIECLTPDLRAEIRQYRAELIELLGQHGDSLLPLFAYRPWEEPDDLTCSAPEPKEKEHGVA